MGVCVFLSGVWEFLKEKQEKSLPFRKKIGTQLVLSLNAVSAA